MKGISHTVVDGEGLLAKYVELYDRAPVAYFTLDGAGVIRQANLSGAGLLGVDRALLVNRPLGLYVSAASRPVFEDFLASVFARKEQEVCEVELLREGDRPLFARVEAVVSGTGAECGAVVVDITERRRIDERSALQIKEVLHRVKNNLNVILSLAQQCRFSLKSAQQAETRAVLEDLEVRIMGIVLLHTHLNQRGSGNSVDMAAYLRSIADMVSEHHARADIALRAEVAPASFNVETAMACGLLANELLTNAFKHAFPAKTGGRVALTFAAVADGGSWRLMVEDDGVGLPRGFDVAACSSMGMQLVASLARQLRARMAIAAPGTSFTFDFSEIRYSNRIWQ